MMISCGCCKTKHDTVAQVKACYAAKYANKVQVDALATPVGTVMMITPPTPELDLKTPEFVAAIQAKEAAEDAKAYAIDTAQNPTEWFLAGFTPEQPKAEAATTPGMYTKNGQVFRVKSSKAGYLYAQLVTMFDGKPTYTYAPKVFKSLTVDDKMSLEDAEAYSLKINHCCCCGKLLTNSKSVTLGIGPVCRKKYF